MPGIRLLAVTLALTLAVPAPAQAQFPIAPAGTEGIRVFVGGGAPVIATYLGNSASFSNDLFLALDAAGNPGDDGDLTNDLFIFNNHASAVNSTANLGSFSPGTELIFRLFVRNTGHSFYSGPASRNPDNRPHARALTDWMPGTTLVSFEDLLNTPEFPGGYNDLSFSFTNTVASVNPPPISTVPEPGTIGLFALGLAGLTLLRRHARR